MDFSRNAILGLKNQFGGVGNGFWGGFGPAGGCGKAFWVRKNGILEVGNWAIYIFSATSKFWGRSPVIARSQWEKDWEPLEEGSEARRFFSEAEIGGSLELVRSSSLADFFSLAIGCSSSTIDFWLGLMRRRMGEAAGWGRLGGCCFSFLE